MTGILKWPKNYWNTTGILQFPPKILDFCYNLRNIREFCTAWLHKKFMWSGRHLWPEGLSKGRQTRPTRPCALPIWARLDYTVYILPPRLGWNEPYSTSPVCLSALALLGWMAVKMHSESWKKVILANFSSLPRLAPCSRDDKQAGNKKNCAAECYAGS